MSWKRIVLMCGVILALLVLLSACGARPTPDEGSTQTSATANQSTNLPAGLVIPFQADWAASGHADVNAAAFTHWNAAESSVIPATCSRCHSSSGLEQYIKTGSTLDVPAPDGVIVCTTCHNQAVDALTAVTFPSGKVIKDLGPEARCMSCHQGRESKPSVDAYIEMTVGAEAAPDVSSPDLSFRNVHYFTAGAMMYASMASGGYEYDGQVYDGKFTHIENMDTCLDCHDSHSLKVKIAKCAECHENADSVENLKNTRMLGSQMDYDGDGNRAEGIYYEIQGLQEKLYQAIQSYATNINQTSIIYDPATYPYFLIDSNNDGQISKGEAVASNGYIKWTPRLIKAAYNYHFSLKDPGAFAHNAKYAIQLLYDSITDLNSVLPTPIDISKAHRIDAGHFAGSSEAFRHWDAAGEVDAACARCHTARGLPQFLQYGANIGVTISDGLMCSTCHIMETFPTLRAVPSVSFPGGKVVSFGGKDVDGNFVDDHNNICLLCHQGRESTASVNARINGKEPNTIDPTLTFINSHYFASGAMLFGNDAQVGYQYPGRTYLGQNLTHPLNKCVQCHDNHSGELKTDLCAPCHPGNATTKTIRYGTDNIDWDGDGNLKEPIRDEIDTLQQALLAQIMAYANGMGEPIAYGPGYPYFTKDLNGNGVQDPDEAVRTNAYTSFTPNLLTAAYNYHFVMKEPGSFTHNPKYAIQLLIDSLAAIGGDTSKYTRP